MRNESSMRRKAKAKKKKETWKIRGERKEGQKNINSLWK